MVQRFRREIIGSLRGQDDNGLYPAEADRSGKKTGLPQLGIGFHAQPAAAGLKPFPDSPGRFRGELFYPFEAAASPPVYPGKEQCARRPNHQNKENAPVIVRPANQLRCVPEPIASRCGSRGRAVCRGGNRKNLPPCGSRNMPPRPYPGGEQGGRQGDKQEIPTVILEPRGQPMTKQPFQTQYDANEARVPQVSYQKLFQEHCNRLIVWASCPECPATGPGPRGSDPSAPES